MKIKGSKLAAAAGVRQSFLNKEIVNGNLIRDDKKLYDLEILINRDWLVRHGGDPDNLDRSEPIPVKPKIKPAKIQTTQQIETKKNVTRQEIPDLSGGAEGVDFDVISGVPEKMLNMTIKELVLQYQGFTGLKGYADILNTLMSARSKEVKIQEIRKDLISKDFMIHLKSFLDDLSEKLFDYAETCLIEIIPLAKTNEDIARKKIPELLTKNFGKIIEQCKRKIQREIKNHMKDKEEDV